MKMVTNQPVDNNPFEIYDKQPLLWVSIAFLAGIALAGFIAPEWFEWGVFLSVLGFFLLLLTAIFFLNRSINRIGVILLILASAATAGALRYLMAFPMLDPQNIVFYADRNYDVLVTGWVKEMPDERDGYTNLKIQTQYVDTGDGDLPVSGLILVRVSPNQHFEYGQVIRLRGQLKTPPDADEQGEFSYRDYLSIHDIYAYMTSAEATIYPEQAGNFFFRAIYAFKTRSLENIYRIYPDPEASLLAGILLGVDTGLTKQVQTAFKHTGTSHIIAISGFNIAIIAGLFMSVFGRMFGERLGSWLAVFGVIFYTILVGADAAVMRAALMGMISIFARQVGRRQVGLVTLMAVAALMCLLFSPLYIWDVGFQLSFFATLGLILYAEPFSNFMGNLFRRMLPADTANAITNPFNDFVVLTFAAQLTTIPIMVYHFQQLSLVSFIANPFILPVQPMVMLAGGFSLLASHIWIVLGKIAGFVAWPFALYTIRAVEFFNWKSWVLYFTNVSVVFPVLYYVILFAMTFFSDQVKNLFKGIKSAVLPATAVVLFACVIFTWKYAYTGSDDKLHITFMNVGSADAILVQSPTGRRVLINGGPKASLLSESLGRSLPPFSRQLDWLVIASTNENQLTALPRLLDRYPPENVLWSGNPQASFSARQVQEWLIEDQTPITFAEQGQRLDLGQGAFIEVAAIGPRGSVLSIQWNNFQALLPIGVDLQSLQLEPDALDVLLLADSGYAPSNPEEWIKRANPQLIVLDVAAGDENGMPSQDTLKAVGGYTLLRTDMNGWISIATDGETMQVEVQKK